MLFAGCGGAAVSSAVHQSGYRPSAANLEARRWFQDAKFGMFVHWGVYSVLGAGEWVMENRPIPATDYEGLPSSFNPIAYDPAEWVAVARAAGMKYITFTAKHHDGFAMFDSRVSDYDIVDRTPYAKDVTRMLVDAARKAGIRVFFYYSQLDWHHSDYYPRGGTGRSAGRPDHGTWSAYLDYVDAQLGELLTGYGEVGGIWFDGEWDKPGADWRLERTYRLIHGLQPQALIGSNHHGAPHPGEDIQMFEKDLPGQHTTGFNPGQPVSVLPLETAETVNNSWGFNLTDRSFKDTRDLVRYLVRAAGANANFLLNVGPMPTGKIQPEFVERLREMGQWLAAYGESVYGTRGGPVASRPWGVTTQKRNHVYVHLLDWPRGDSLWLPLERRITSARLLGREGTVRFREVPHGVVLEDLPATPPDDFDTVIVLEMAMPRDRGSGREGL